MLLIQGARQKAVPRRIMGTSCARDMRLEPPFIRQDRRFRRKLEAVRAVAEDVAERGAVAQNRSEIEEVSPRGCRLAWGRASVSNTSASLGPQMTKWLSLGSCCVARHPTSVVTCFFSARLFWIIGAQ
jgi:hypothetical protein